MFNRKETKMFYYYAVALSSICCPFFEAKYVRIALSADPALNHPIWDSLNVWLSLIVSVLPFECLIRHSTGWINKKKKFKFK